MSTYRRLILPFAFAGLALAVAAQNTGQPTLAAKPDPNAKPQEAPASRPGPLPPIVFARPLPTTAVATIDGKPVSQGELLEFVLRGNISTVSQTLVLVNVLAIELQRAGVTVTEEEITNEQKKIVERLAPGKTPEEVAKSGAFSAAEMRRQAWLGRGWEKLFLKEKNLDSTQTANDPNQILKQLFMRQKLEGYEVRLRGQNPGPEAGLVAEIRAKAPATEVAKVTGDQALEFLMGLVKPGSLRDALNEVIDATLINRELAKTQATVTEEDVETWALSQQEKYKPPFDWRMICQFKGTTPDQERERWRRIQAWKRATSYKPADAEIETYLKDNEDFFSGRNVSVSHILVNTIDLVTGLGATEEADKAARAKIDAIREKCEEGIDFGWLAERYSDDTGTAKNKGALAQPVKKFGGGLDPDFQHVAWELKPGDISKPVKSRFGYHIIKCDKVSDGRKGIDYKTPTYWDWIVDEFETMKMKSWAKGLHDAAKITTVPDAELFKLKDIKFAP